MNDSNNLLLDLLRLSEGHLLGDRAAELHLRIQQDPTLQARWRLLRKTAATIGTVAELPEADFTLGQPSEEIIGAFLSAQLSPTEIVEVEKQIWDSPPLLREVIDQYRFQALGPPRNGTRTGLQARLKDLVDWEDHTESVESQVRGQEPLVPQSNGHENPKSCSDSETTTPRSTVVPIDPADTGELSRTNPVESHSLDGVTQSGSQVPPPLPRRDTLRVRPKSSRAASLGSRRYRNWRLIVAIAGSVAVLVLVGTGIWGLTRRQGLSPRLSDERGTNQTPSEIRKRPANDPLQTNEQLANDAADARQSELPEEQDRIRNREERLPGFQPVPESLSMNGEQSPSGHVGELSAQEVEAVFAGDDELESTWPNLPERENDPTEDRKPAETQLLALQWKKVTGLLAIRDDVRATWVGRQASNAPLVPEMVATLPGSWANADVGEFGEFVLRQDSMAQFSIVEQSMRPVLKLKLVYGMAALKGLQESQGVVVEVQGESSFIEVLEPETEIAIALQAGEPIVSVRQGAVSVEGESVNVGFQVLLNQKSLRPVPSEQTSQATRWFDRPERGGSVPGRLADEINGSNDLAETLLAWGSSANSEVRTLGVNWGMTLYPQVLGAKILEAEDSDLRGAGVEWLIMQDPNKPASRRLWRTLSSASNDPKTVRLLYRWSALARGGKRLPQTDAQQMLQTLNHDKLVMRHASAHLLTLAFGNPLGYKAELPPIQRRTIIARWRNLVAESYGRRFSSSNGANNRRNQN